MRRTTAALFTATLIVTGCTTGDDTPELSDPVAPVERPAPSDDAAPAPADTLDPVRVVLALTVLTTGDVEAALAEGLLEQDEVAAADAAITAGTVQDWFDRAAATVAAE